MATKYPLVIRQRDGTIKRAGQITVSDELADTDRKKGYLSDGRRNYTVYLGPELAERVAEFAKVQRRANTNALEILIERGLDAFEEDIAGPAVSRNGEYYLDSEAVAADTLNRIPGAFAGPKGIYNSDEEKWAAERKRNGK